MFWDKKLVWLEQSEPKVGKGIEQSGQDFINLLKDHSGCLVETNRLGKAEAGAGCKQWDQQ